MRERLMTCGQKDVCTGDVRMKERGGYMKKFIRNIFLFTICLSVLLAVYCKLTLEASVKYMGENTKQQMKEASVMRLRTITTAISLAIQGCIGGLIRICLRVSKHIISHMTMIAIIRCITKYYI